MNGRDPVLWVLAGLFKAVIFVVVAFAWVIIIGCLLTKNDDPRRFYFRMKW